MRVGSASIKYKYTARECAEMLKSSPAFSHIIVDDLVVRAESNVLGNPPYCPMIDYMGVWHYNINDFVRFAVQVSGCKCSICKEMHFLNYTDVCKILDPSSIMFLSEPIEFVQCPVPPLCASCAEAASKRIWGRRGILKNMEEYDENLIQLAVIQWIAESLVNIKPKGRA